MVNGTTVDLAPPSVLAQREGIDAALRVALAEVLVGETFANRPAWMRVGAARYFAHRAASTSGHAHADVPGSATKLACPADAELTLATSAAAQRDADARAERCFARAASKVDDWRSAR